MHLLTIKNNNMRAILTSFGTTGDFLPYLALAVELHRHGHQPVLAYPPYYRSLADRYGLEFIPIGPDLHATLSALITAMPTLPESAAEMHALFAPFASALPQMFQE